ncbi:MULTISPECIES: EAL domain-containing protein [unclassified Undibacterium]|uniref:bifunctional diguanylate cyclase/phosphodiesterase n=2 Tax=Bacteria TaxID=2 RepID=UPI002AC8CB50|nr:MULTISPECIES: EAL domain-containing protein [unclassified Undibacterium]MEB0138033.1 EAL domain-containing protein [Undibacterium sp. CCC2.1]MEB0171229.1 EAL domain-containing protein [Undibacterium sp. CCC1.1]MEB0175274.1 EAL domain-containing protein [Undibacterium sp. CCC3.4]MEB0214682.1 EAL domain-containing protein [Undibacterium sp. 5I2]WPX42449.1 EAL domain-containing protein [Undibacterium sp. CCC3.4]
MHSTADDLVFLDEPEHDEFLTANQASWRIMIIDDDPDVHSATTFALGSLEIQHRPLSFLHAYSAAEARDILQKESDIAIILLDVVMEQEDAGLQLVSYIRSTLQLADVRIILRTGQPGYAPEIDAIRDYDINDYKTKSELTRTKLYTAVTSAIRSYEQICAINDSRRGLELIVSASNTLMGSRGLHEFAVEVLSQITDLLKLDAAGLICARPHPVNNQSADDALHIIAATTQFASLLNTPLKRQNCQQAHDIVTRSLSTRQSIYQPTITALYFNNVAQEDFSLYLETGLSLNDMEQRLLEVFCGNVSIGLDNVILNTRLHNYAFYDLLTGLCNRLKLLQTINETLASARKNRSALALIDIDHFAETNDALGHQFGDLLLVAVAQRLSQYFGSLCQIARVGSDTFALLGDVELVSPKKILALFTAPFDVDHQEVQLSATIGLIKFDDYDGDGSEALKDTNIALKRAKTHQRGGFEYFTRNMGVDIRERVLLMHALRAAFEHEKLFLVYQPQVDMSTGKILGAEALLRWQTDDGKFIPPDQFIPIAEYSGLIIDIGEWVLRSACTELVHLRSLGHTDFQMAINVSQAQFSHPLFMETLQKALHDTQVPPQFIELEITESMAMNDPDLLVKTLHQIKQLGVSVSIDDFGTGFSSLSHLQKLHVDKLKIDRAFVNEIQKDANQGSIAKMIVQLGQSLGLAIIAEGVENQMQAEALLSFGCHLAQGYFYARPLPRQELYAWLAQRP